MAKPTRPIFNPNDGRCFTPEQCRIMNNVWRVLNCDDTPSNRTTFWFAMYRDTSAVELYHAVKRTVNDRYWKRVQCEAVV